MGASRGASLDVGSVISVEHMLGNGWEGLEKKIELVHTHRILRSVADDAEDSGLQARYLESSGTAVSGGVEVSETEIAECPEGQKSGIQGLVPPPPQKRL